MDIITGAIISGVIYDVIKHGASITAKSIKNYFDQELLELSNDQARQIAEQARNIDFGNVNNISKEKFIEDHQNQFHLNNNVTNTVNQNLDNITNSGTFLNNSAGTLNQNIVLPDINNQKKS